MLRKKITIGAGASARSRQTSRSTLECTGDSEGRTASIAVRPRNPRPVPITFYRDEIFDVTVTVSGTPHYVGTLELELCKGKGEQTLGSRGKVKMHDFGIEEVDQNSNRRLITDVTRLRFESKHKGKRTFKAVINTAQTVRIKATEVINSDGDLNESLSAETDDIYIAHSLRKYGLHATHMGINDYDSYINGWVNYWDDWKIPVQTDKTKAPEHHTFMTDTVPDGDLVKAVTYRESTLLEDNEPNMMQLTDAPLEGMQTGHEDVLRDVNASKLGVQNADGTYSGTPDADGTYSGILREATPFMNYQMPTEETITIDDSFQWGIRWLIDKRTKTRSYNGTTGIISGIEIIDWWGPTGAVKLYGDTSLEYPRLIEALYAEGKNPNSETPKYLWPIKVDKTPREDDASPPAETSKENAEESPETPPQE